MPHVKAAPGKIVNLDNGVTVDQFSNINVDVTLPLAAAALSAGNIIQLDSATAPTWPGPSGSSTTTNTLTAHSGGGQASAVALPTRFNRVTTVAAAGDSVKLPAAQAGIEVFVANAAAANAMNVFPNTGDTINALAANAAFSIAAGKVAHFICTNSGQWHAILSA